MDRPKGFDGATLLSIWKRFIDSNQSEKVIALASRKIHELHLWLKLYPFALGHGNKNYADER